MTLVEPILTDAGRRRLAAIFERGAEDASAALSKWLDRPVRLTVSAVDEIDPAESADLLGPADRVVAACCMGLLGRLTGQLLLVFDDRSGLALTDLLLRQPEGTATAWGEIEQSAAMETANIVGCAYLNSLATHLPASDAESLADGGAVVPSPPAFRHEFAGTLLEFALMDQAIRLDRLLLVRTRFEAAGTALDWSLLLVPSGEALAAISASLGNLENS